MTHELGGDTVGALWRRYLCEFQSALTRKLRNDGDKVRERPFLFPLERVSLLFFIWRILPFRVCMFVMDR